MSESRKGKTSRLGCIHTPATKLKISLALTGRKESEETRIKKSIAHLGRKVSEETKVKLRAASVIRFASTKGICRTCKRPVKPEECLQSALQYGWWGCLECERKRSRLKRLRREGILRAYGSKCACCGESVQEFLTIDHINGGGRQHKLSVKNALYYWIEKNGYPKDFRLLCSNCNHSLGSYGYCPHQTPKNIITTHTKILL
jgi:hypothetical protein